MSATVAERTGRVNGSPGQRPGRLRLVADRGRLVAHGHLGSGASGGAHGAPLAPVRTPAALQRPTARRGPVAGQAVAARPRAAARSPVRLTRRGRVVVTAAAMLLIGGVSMALASAAQATGHSGAAGGQGRYVTRVAVRPGQSLWSLAEAYDPDADTRLVIQEIVQLNSLTGEQVQPGQVLWVPRE